MESPETPDMDHANPPGLKALAMQLADDAKVFALAEAEWIKAEAGERANIAKPALIAILVGLALVFGVATAVPVGVMLLLTPYIGPGWALLASVLLFVTMAAMLFLFGSQRIKAAFKPRSDA